MEVKIIGLAGPVAVGKTTLAEYLRRTKGYSVYSCSETIGLMVRRGLFSDVFPEVVKYFGSSRREDYLALGKELRSKYGDDIIVELTLRRAFGDGARKIVVDGVRGVAEMRKIQEYGGVVFFLDAPVEVLYERFRSRRKAIDGDEKSFDKFLRILEAEDRDFGVSASKDAADVIVRNDGPFERLVRVFDV